MFRVRKDGTDDAMLVRWRDEGFKDNKPLCKLTWIYQKLGDEASLVLGHHGGTRLGGLSAHLIAD